MVPARSNSWSRALVIGDTYDATAARHKYARETRELERKEANGRPTGWPTTDTPLRVVACHKSCRSCTTGQEKRSQSYRRRATIRVSDWSVPAEVPLQGYRKHDREYIYVILTYVGAKLTLDEGTGSSGRQARGWCIRIIFGQVSPFPWGRRVGRGSDMCEKSREMNLWYERSIWLFCDCMSSNGTNEYTWTWKNVGKVKVCGRRIEREKIYFQEVT